MTMGDLAETLDVSPRTVTGLVDNLERDGLVKRVDDPGDRRTVHAELTDQGRERVKALWRGARARPGELTRGVRAARLGPPPPPFPPPPPATGVAAGRPRAPRPTRPPGPRPSPPRPPLGA